MDNTVTVGTDYKELLSPIDEPVFNKQVTLLKKFWAGFHNMIIVALLSSLLGIGIGIKACKDFFVSKLDECTQTGAMLHKSKVYTINLKL